MKDLGQVKLLDFLLQPRRQTGIHARATREDDVLVEFRSRVDRSGLLQIKHVLVIELNEPEWFEAASLPCLVARRRLDVAETCIRELRTVPSQL
jgi:hypothetical protein